MAQSDVYPTGDQEFMGQATFIEIDHEIVSVVKSLPSADSRRAVVSFWQKKVLSG